MTSLLLAGTLACWAAAEEPIPVILDTDLGGDIDDTWALAMVLGCPQLDLKLVVTSTDDTPTKTRLVAKILDRVGRTDIPLGQGVKTSDRAINQAAWLGDYTLDTYPGKVYEDGVQAMIDLIMASESTMPLIVIGPQANLKEALEREPRIAEKSRIVAMAGSVHIGYGGKHGREPECNIVSDVESARAVFAAPWDITMVPLDGCGTLQLRGERYARVCASNELRAQAVIENYELWANRKHLPPDASSILFDTVAVYLVFDDAFCTMEDIHLSVDDEGDTVPDEKGRPVRCALGWKDRDAFEELLVDAVTRPIRPPQGRFRVVE